MPLSEDAKTLLSNHPELIKDLCYHFMDSASKPYINEPEWTHFVQKNTEEKGLSDFCISKPTIKEWEILSYKTYGSGTILSRKEWMCLVETQYLYAIHSVKRLSDGEVFTVGDEVKYTGEKCNYGSFIITNFFVKCDGNMLARSEWNNICEDVRYIKKTEKPLFITEDGKPVYAGDRVWWVRLSDYGMAEQSIFVDGSNHEGFKYFSVNKAAKEYILLNKPCLSMSDVATFFNPTNPTCEFGITELRKIAKSKF